MRRNLLVVSGTFCVAFIILFISCSKINLPTDIGQGLIPDVDNIHTFDTTIDVESYNHFYASLNDTLRARIGYEQFLGVIDNDPLFGKTDARLFFQVGLPNSKFYFPNTPDKLFIDSVVLVLNHVETYGDSTIPQTIQVSEISQAADFRYDSLYNIATSNFPTTTVLGTASILPHTLNDSVYFGTDTVKSIQDLRIKLDNSFGNRLMAYDSTNAFLNDSAFFTHFKGFALQSISGGNAAMGFNLSNSNTRLVLYYRFEKKETAGDIDTTSVTFSPSYGYNSLTGAISQYSATANYITRNYSGTALESASGDNVEDQFVYIQNTPGTYATLKIPALANMSNRIIHLAELQMQSVYDVSDTLFYAPKLFIDAYNSTTGNNLNLPYVFNDYASNGSISQVGLGLFGSWHIDTTDGGGNDIKFWRFNMTRYVQNIVNGNKPLYDLRLYAKPGFTIKDTLYYGAGVQTPTELGVSMGQSTKSSLAAPLVGRVRLAGGTHPVQKMKMRIVYSKL
ncbi:MAG: DUF4270 domain-containing protein [Niabella sp.]